MPYNPERRISTGGLPPIRVHEECVVEKAPSYHDPSIPCYSAWIREEIVKVPEGWLASDFTIANKRPQRSFQIYNTTSQAANLDRLQTLAREFQTELCKDHGVGGRDQTARIDVWAKPFTANESEETKINTCKAHILAEITARELLGDGSFHISKLSSHNQWKRFLLIMDQPEESWDQDKADFLAVYWDHHSGPETRTRRCTRKELGMLLEDLTNFF